MRKEFLNKRLSLERRIQKLEEKISLNEEGNFDFISRLPYNRDFSKFVKVFNFKKSKAPSWLNKEASKFLRVSSGDKLNYFWRNIGNPMLGGSFRYKIWFNVYFISDSRIILELEVEDRATPSRSISYKREPHSEDYTKILDFENETQFKSEVKKSMDYFTELMLEIVE